MVIHGRKMEVATRPQYGELGTKSCSTRLRLRDAPETTVLSHSNATVNHSSNLISLPYPTPAPIQSPSHHPQTQAKAPSAPIITMCLLRINPSRAPIDPPGAAPVLMTLEEDHMLSIMAGNEAGPNPISDLVDAKGKPQPIRPVSHESLQERRETLANGTRRVEIGK